MAKSKPLDMNALEQIEEAAGIVEPKGAAARTRVDKKGLLTYHSSTVIKQLKRIAIDQDSSQQRLVEEALNMLFVKYQASPIA